MSDGESDAHQAVFACTLGTAEEPDSLLLPGHDVPLGRYTTVRRLLPQRRRRMVGAWCFVDHFGPSDVTGRPGMQIAPHPHTGLQTVTWLADGEIVHADSLGNLQPIAPGQLNLMTSGHGIAHSEQSPPEHPPVMHGLQLWIALPEDARHGEPRFEHHGDLPVLRDGAATVTVVAGELAGARSPARVHSPLFGAEIRFGGPGSVRLPVEPTFEAAVLTMSGTADVAGTALEPGSLLYLGRGREELDVRAAGEARLFLFGGAPFEEPLVMWWNFVGRSHEEIVRARADWEDGTRFGVVGHCTDAPLPAPALPTVRLKARDRHGETAP
ncbi:MULTISPECIES: pirin family protein [unclassified Streptomyces]|uniref:pirin family protein n=1 Tax=unclassified Streptomyces TaxID=2593676 RepID=UPI0022B74E68|nr:MULTISPECIES: pirin family protein [unclassified Streptomyces]MCZ7413654.1 pirin family protein [Streptomyces sp. WMMC897]MCZ7430651.1 pirin family protein [Streptomyces sp. WMMC1477]